MLARIVPGVLAMLLLVACGSGSNWQAKPEQHIVRKGETLFSIAWRYGKDPTDVARWNRLGDGSLIYPGQVIRLTPPSGDRQRSASTRSSRQPLPSIPAQPPPAWGWPTRGQIRVEFGGKPGSGTGVLIDGRSGQAIVAAASGKVGSQRPANRDNGGGAGTEAATAF
jgi:lipoprotein NlpD